LAAAGIYALNHNIQRLAEDHRHARMLAEGLADIGRIGIHPNQVESNIVIFDISKTRYTPCQALEALRREKILVVPFGKHLLRAVTHLHVGRKEIEQTIRVFRKVFMARV
jgi:threonine aldolase